MTTIIRGKSGKDDLIDLLVKHGESVAQLAYAKNMIEPLIVREFENPESFMAISKDELTGVINTRLQVINTKLENLGLKIGDEIAESAQ